MPKNRIQKKNNIYIYIKIKKKNQKKNIFTNYSLKIIAVSQSIALTNLLKKLNLTILHPQIYTHQCNGRNVLNSAQEILTVGETIATEINK